MIKKIISILLICLVINVSGVNASFDNKSGDKKRAKREAAIKKRTIKIKKAVAKLGIGKKSIVKLKLRDKTKLKGYISQINENSFTIIDKNGKAINVEYRKAKQIKGNNLHAGVWVAVGVGATLLVLYLIWRGAS